MKMNAALIFCALLPALLFSSQFVSADAAQACNLNVSLVNQDPLPAVPDSYVDVVFQVSGVDDSSCTGARFEVIPAYPFSLDGADAVKILQGPITLPNHKKEWLVAYKLRVDKDALDGDNPLEVHYNPTSWDQGTYVSQKLNITIQDSRTNFDAVIQEASMSEVSLAIANTGKYTANAVIVKIPEQNDIMVTGTNGQMVGNLDSGDYTLVSFAIAPKRAGISPDASSQELKFEIYYTDNLGERRVVPLELPLNLAAGNSSIVFGNGNFAARRTAGNAGSSQNSFMTFVWIALALIAAFFLYKKFGRRIFRKKSSHEKTPDWMKKAKEKTKGG